jgi:acyl-coenzyme A thioesterase PaaI-like protein
VDQAGMLQGLNEAVPFNRHLGLKYVSVDAKRCVVMLPDDQRLQNHIASQHASGLFAAGEAASGGVFVAAFAEQLGSLRPLVKSVEVAYSKVARGEIAVEATLGEDVQSLLDTLERDGRVEFPVAVKMRDGEGNEVASMNVHWHVKQIAAPAEAAA